MSAPATAAGQLIPADGAAGDLGRQRLGARAGAAGDDDLADPVRAQVLCGQGRDLAGAHHQHAPPFQPAEDLARQLDGGKAHRDRAFAERRLGSHPLADPEGRLEQARQQGADALPVGGDLERVLDLAQDLRLADDHGIEAGRHAKQVPRRVAVRPLEQVRHERLGLHPVIAGQELDDFSARLQRIVAGDVDLRAVAGREQHRLRGRGARRQCLHGRAEIAGREVQPLPQLDRRRPVTHAQQEKMH